MRRKRLCILFCAIAFSGLAVADEAATLEAEKLLDSMNMQATLDGAISTMLNLQIDQKPELAPFKNVMSAFLAKYMSYAALKPDLVTIYASEFSASELRDIRNFYATPSGKKSIEKMPALMGKGAAIGAKSVQDHIQELQQIIKDESERIRKLKGTKDSTSK